MFRERALEFTEMDGELHKKRSEQTLALCCTLVIKAHVGSIREPLFIHLPTSLHRGERKQINNLFFYY